jgi:hypothetical protein
MGHYAMEYAWIGLIAELHTPKSKLGDQWDVAPIPQALPGGKRYNIVSGQGFAVIQGRQAAGRRLDLQRLHALGRDPEDARADGVWFPSRRSLARFGIPADGVPKNYLVPFHELVDKNGISPWWYVPGYNDWEAVFTKELAACWDCARNGDDADAGDRAGGQRDAEAASQVVLSVAALPCGTRTRGVGRRAAGGALIHEVNPLHPSSAP